MSIFPDCKNFKAVALDLDGTLLAPGAVLTERTVKAVKACMSSGLRVIITTGRAIEAAERFRLPLGTEGPMVYFNGAVVAEMPEGKILITTLLDIKVAEFCVDLSRELGIYCQLYLPGGANRDQGSRMALLAEWDGPELEMYHNHTGIKAETYDLKKVLVQPEHSSGCVKAMFLTEPENHPMLRQRLEERFGSSIYVVQTLRTFLEVMNPAASKGQGLKFTMDCLSLKGEEVIAFGDEENDLPLLAAAGFSVAPSNAQDSVKAKADLIIGSNAEDGVAAFLESFFGL